MWQLLRAFIQDPAEVNTSIRPGWFYHPEEDGQVKSLNDLVSLYEKSVGGNATFLLNIPPARNGLIHDNDVHRLAELGEYIKKAFSENLVPQAKLACNSKTKDDDMENLVKDSYDSSFEVSSGKERADTHAATLLFSG